METIIVMHGEKRLRKEIDNFCRKCDSDPYRGWCYIKNQRACEKVQANFGDRIHGTQKDEYVCHPSFITITSPANRFTNIVE